MRRSRKILLSIVAMLLVLVGFAYLNNANFGSPPTGGKPTLLAHRGVAQRFSLEGVTNDTCTATRIEQPTNDYLENTIPSMQAGFDAGADIVELDVHPTTDGQFAVFHDWTLDCRTNGTGVTREHTLAELKALDIGYGYTADGGMTFPFRGKGIGLLPSLDDVLLAFPGRRLLINVKSNDPAEGDLLAAKLASLDPAVRANLMVYGGAMPIAALRARLPEVKSMSIDSLKACLFPYLALGWTGMVPDACRNGLLYIPTNIAPFVWGWPTRFLDRMASVDTEVFVVGPYTGGSFSTGIDTSADLDALPTGFAGGILTNEIATIAPAVKAPDP